MGRGRSGRRELVIQKGRRNGAPFFRNYVWEFAYEREMFVESEKKIFL